MMPPIASWALYRQNPPLVSASMPYVRFPPRTGLALSGAVVDEPLFVLEPPFLLLLPHADAITASAATTARAVVARDLRLRTTGTPRFLPERTPRRISPMSTTNIAKRCSVNCDPGHTSGV